MVNNKLTILARLVLFLKSEGFNSTQIRYICTKKLNIKGINIYRKIAYLSKNIENQEAERRWEHDHIAKKLKISGILDELKEWKKTQK